MKIDSSAIGIEVSWSFGYGDAEAVTLPRIAVRNAIKANGFPGSLIETPMLSTALRKALQLVKGRSKTIVVQEMRKPNKDTPMCIGVYQVQGKDESGDNVVCGARARIQPTGVVEALPPEGATEIPACMVVARELARIANTLVHSVVNREISDTLTFIGWGLDWITRRRNSGGVYFIPSGPDAERFVSLLQDLEALTKDEKKSNRFYPQIMEVYAKPLSMAMWSNAAVDQYEAKVADLVADLKRMTADDAPTRETTLEKRAEECDKLIASAEGHRIFLAEHAAALTAEIRRIRGEFERKLLETREGTMAAIDAAVKEPAAIPVRPIRSVRPAAPAPTPVRAHPTRVQHPKRVRPAAPAPLKPMTQMTVDELFSID